ncbi:zinc finger protein 518A [Rhinatrema bivittatum]|uniref:zinc finger protein 518A n=1 Tax=Rhinatrema bivittatum TaxID=194408 RepID=UPI0011263CCB|nr:zinc finger protein 518A [Rhinatrema bivittatum]XP_029465814.1 zinc finger protein 518A [Rhinatrema bivittatum]XP_029465815.1 zinc finger protein 518A [Rhinatrema bivittatum]XP_029465816.1 zinc finger protein 518A [Rhinatrema bivittatum]XP_029465817.1 zinc finger protein 518A [Rhinatrema bivittatum]
MQAGKDQSCFDTEPQATLLDDDATTFCEPDDMIRTCDDSSIPVIYQPSFPDKSILYELKNIKIELPKVTISDKVAVKHVDGHTKLYLHKPQTARKSLKARNVNGSHRGYNVQVKLEGQAGEEGVNTTAKILNFCCTKCKGTTRYSPNDLQKHFQLLHHGELPLYPCEMCSFSANDFQSFKQHRRTHRSTLVKCEICNDEHLYTLLDLTKHFTLAHCVNGHFRCEKCKFSTRDVGTFVQHIHRHNEIQYKCGKCSHVSFTKGESQRHLVVHTGTYPFSCQYCSYSATRKDYILKHVVALHRDQLYVKDKLDKDSCEKRLVKTSSGLKLVLSRYKTGASKKVLWRQKNINTAAGTVVEKNRLALRSMDSGDDSSEDQSQLMEVFKVKEEKNQTLHNLLVRNRDGDTHSATATKYNKGDGQGSGVSLLKDAIHGPTVLMVKNNKISVPANYCAKFMGFKVVDGRQHIVIKLLPTNKQDLHTSELQPEAVKDCSTDLSSKITSRPHGLSSSGATAHAIKLHIQQYKPSHPLSVSIPDAHSSDKVNVEMQKNNSSATAISPCVLSFPVTVKEGTSSTAVQLCSPTPLAQKTETRNSNSTAGANLITRTHSLNLCSKFISTHNQEPSKMPFPMEQKLQLKKAGENTACAKKHILDDSLDNKRLASVHNYFVMTDDRTSTNSKSDEECEPNQSFSPQSQLDESASSGYSLMESRNLDSWPLLSKISKADTQENITTSNLCSVSESNTEKLSFMAKRRSFNQGLESIHNYFVMADDWNPTFDKAKEESISNQSLPHKSSVNIESASSRSPLMKDRNHDDSWPLPSKNSMAYGQDDITDVNLISVSESDAEKTSFMAEHQDTVVKPVSETCNIKSNLQETILDHASLHTMPKITSVFSLQNEQASDILFPEENCLLKNRLKRKLNVDQNISTPVAKMMRPSTLNLLSTGNTVSYTKYPIATDSLSSSLSTTTKPDMNISCSIASSNKYYEKQIPANLHSSKETDKLSQTSRIGALQKPQPDALTQQLVNEKICVNVKNPSDLSSLKVRQMKPLTVSEGSNAFLVHSSTKRVLLPLQLANQPALQVVSGETLSSNAHTVKGGPGMVLTFSSGTFGAVANITGNHSQVFSSDSCNQQSKISPTPKLTVKMDNASSLSSSTATDFNNSASSIANSVTSMALKGRFVKNSADTTSEEICSAKMATVPTLVKKLPVGMSVIQHKSTQAVISDSLQSVKECQETQQKQSIYALLPNGRPVILKYVAANSTSVPTNNFIQGSAFNRNSQPKKTEGMHQKVFLKIVKSTSFGLPTVSKNQSQINSIASLNLDGMQSLHSFAQETKSAIISSNNALILPTNLIPQKACLVSSNSRYNVPPKESHTKRIATWMPRCSTDSTRKITACKQNSSSNQKDKLNFGNSIPKNKANFQKTGISGSEEMVTLRNRRVKRTSKDHLWEPPTKRTLHRKCKGKNQTEDIDEAVAPRLMASKDTLQTLRLLPFSSIQLVKCPRRNQPVVVLNHPDADVPEVVNVMKTIAKFKGHVLKVLLSERTINALLDPASYNSSGMATEQFPSKRHRKLKPLSPVKERFVLKLTLKKTSKNNYQIVKNISCNTLKAKFSCWFCGRAFDNQDDWVGHGQRHLMEATRDWNLLV